MLLMVIVGIVLILAIVAIVAAMVVMGRNMKVQDNAEVVTTKATIIRTYSNSQDHLTVDSANARTTSTYYVEFILDDKSKVSFKIKKKFFLSLYDGDEGVLTYKGNKILEFEKGVTEK